MGQKFTKSRFLKLFSCFLTTVLSLATIIAPTASATLSQQYRSLYSANSILFYNPDEKDFADGEGCGDDVTILGDSITAYATGAIQKLLPGVYVDAIKGTNWTTDHLGQASGIARLQSLISSGKIRKNVVFAFGGNNDGRDGPPLTIEDVNTVYNLLGPDHNIFFITDRDILNPNIYDNNNTLKQQAAAAGWAHIIDWASAVTDSLIYHEDDPDGTYGAGKGVHPNPDGQAKWAELVYSAISPYTQCGGGPSVCLSGDTAEEIIWSGLRVVGFNEIQAAGIMGNMANESGFNPARREDSRRNNDIDIFTDTTHNYGVGLIQWSGVRRPPFLNYMLSIDQNFRNYFLDYQTYSTGATASGNGFLENIGKDTFATLVKHSLDFLWEETNTNYSGYFSNSSTVEQAAEWFLVNNERPRADELEKSRPHRLADAQKFYDQFAGRPFSDDCLNSGGNEGGWFDNFPGYTKEDPYELGIALSEAQQESYTTGGPNKILLHSTEGSTPGISAYPSNNMFPAHFTIDLKSRSVSQHFTINKPSLSIKSHDATGPIQIEIVGFSTANRSSDPKYLGNYTNEDWDYLAKLLKTIHDATGIPLTSSVSWEPGTQRLSAEEFKNYTGILGHMHAPGNDHSDPGNFWEQISAAINRL